MVVQCSSVLIQEQITASAPRVSQICRDWADALQEVAFVHCKPFHKTWYAADPCPSLFAHDGLCKADLDGAPPVVVHAADFGWVHTSCFV